MKEENTVKVLDEFDVASYTYLSVEEAKALLMLTGKAYTCNGISYVKTNDVTFEDFSESLIKEAVAFVKRIKVLEFIEDNPGCLKKDIQEHLLELFGYKFSYDQINLIVTILTEENMDLYEGDDNRLYVRGCDFIPTV